MKVATLASGSSGNAIFIESGQEKILVDAGLSGKSIQKALENINVKPEELSAILVSHEHIDHVKGIGVLSRRFKLPIYATELTWAAMAPKIGQVSESLCCYIETDKRLEFGSMSVEFFASNHDAADPIGFNFYEEDRQLGLVTDIGAISNKVESVLQGADCLILEANHDEEMLKMGSYPWLLKKRIMSDRGHLSNEAAGKSLINLSCGKKQKVLLAHLSEENNLPELAKLTVANLLAEAGIVLGRDLELSIAPRFSPSEVISV